MYKASNMAAIVPVFAPSSATSLAPQPYDVVVQAYIDAGVGVNGNYLTTAQMAVLPANTSLMNELRAGVRAEAGGPADPFLGQKIVDVYEGEHLRPVIVPDIPGLTAGSLSGYEDDEGQVYCGEIIDDAKKVYDLNHVFADINVSDKLRITARYLNYLKRLAVQQPAVAAADLQQKLRDGGYPNYEIRAGRYARGRAQALSRLQYAARESRAPCVSVAADITDAVVLMHYTGIENFIEWTVSGPIGNVLAVQAAYKLCVAYGIHRSVFAYSLDLEIMDVTVTDAINNVVIMPSFVHHVAPQGIEPQGHVMPTAIKDSVRDLMRAHETCVLPVTHGELVIGSAVRVTSKYLLVNKHVLNIEQDMSESDFGLASPAESDGYSGSKLRVGGRRFIQRGSISDDLWVIEMSGSSVDWVYRAPQIGEKVLMCYSVGDNVEYSSVSHVQSFDHNMFAMSRVPQARPGASGAVVMSARDGALLGVYSGESLMYSAVSCFSPSHFGMLADFDSLDESASMSDTTNRLHERIAARGLGAIVERTVSCVLPVYGSKFVGAAVKFDDQIYTTVDPDNEQLKVASGDSASLLPVVFDMSDKRRYVSRSPVIQYSSVPTVVHTRSVELNEKVFVLSRDLEGPFMSESRRVEHVGVSGTLFHVKDFGYTQLPFEGGVIVAERDGAVVGQFVDRVASTGTHAFGMRAMCYGIPGAAAGSRVVVTDLKRVTDGITERFPYLNPSVWPSAAVMDVFVHGSVRPTVGMAERYAALGSAAARWQAMKSMNVVGLSGKEWPDACRSIFTVIRLSESGHGLGLTGLLQVADHVKLSKSSRVYADLVEGFIGLVSEHETLDKLEEVCRMLKLLYDVGTPVAFGFPVSRSISPDSTVLPTIRTSMIALPGPTSPLVQQLVDMEVQLGDLKRKVTEAVENSELEVG